MDLYIEIDYNLKLVEEQDLVVQKKIIKENMYVSCVIRKEFGMKVMLGRL